MQHPTTQLCTTKLRKTMCWDFTFTSDRREGDIVQALKSQSDVR